VADDPSIEEIPYRAILTAIVKRFVQLVGAAAALGAARKLPHLSVDDEGNVLDYDQADPLTSITLLIHQYGAVFGDAAITLARQAAEPLAEAAGENTELLASTMTAPITILLVDDHVLFREGLFSLLDPQPDIRVVGQAGSVSEAITLTRDLKPSLVLMDISLPDGVGPDAARAILADQPNTKIVFLTVHDDDERLFAAIRAGAMGYLIKNVRVAELLAKLRGVARGEAGLSPALARRVLEEFSRTPAPRHIDPSEPTELTIREVEIVRELAGGATNREIARKLVISENTVRNHVRNVLGKLHLRSRYEIANYARDRGLAPPFAPSR